MIVRDIRAIERLPTEAGYAFLVTLRMLKGGQLTVQVSAEELASYQQFVVAVLREAGVYFRLGNETEWHHHIARIIGQRSEAEELPAAAIAEPVVFGKPVAEAHARAASRRERNATAKRGASK